MNEFDHIIMGTGPRSMVLDPNRADIYLILETYLWARYTANPAIVLMSGGAEGWDEAIAKVGMRRGIPYDMVIPTRDYANYYWGNKSLTGSDRTGTFEALCASAREVTFCDNLYQKTWTRRGPELYVDGQWMHANMARNSVMLKCAKEAVILKSNTPGTKDAIRKIRKLKMPHHVYPFIEQEKLF